MTERDLAALVEQVRRDAGDAMAADVDRAARWVVESSDRPVGPECPDVQRCLAKGAAKGARLALQWAEARLSSAAPAVRTEQGPVQVGDRPEPAPAR